jgi:hypothetical protein
MPKDKPMLGLDDLLLLLTHLWARDTCVFLTKDQRYTLATFLLLSIFTGARPAELVDAMKHNARLSYDQLSVLPSPYLCSGDFRLRYHFCVSLRSCMGFFAGGFVSTNAGVMKLVKRQDQSTDIGILLGVIRAGRGIGSLLSGPLSEVLLRGSSWEANARGAGYGSKYGNLVVFTGVTAALGGISFLGKRLGWIP